MTFTGRFGNKPYAPAIEANPSKPEFPILTPKRKAEKLYLDPLFPKGNKAKSPELNKLLLQPLASSTLLNLPIRVVTMEAQVSTITSVVSLRAMVTQQGEGNIGGLGSLLGAATGIHSLVAWQVRLQRPSRVTLTTDSTVPTTRKVMSSVTRDVATTW